MIPICGQCRQPIRTDQYRFGSDQTGWTHMPGDCTTTEPATDDLVTAVNRAAAGNMETDQYEDWSTHRIDADQFILDLQAEGFDIVRKPTA